MLHHIMLLYIGACVDVRMLSHDVCIYMINIPVSKHQHPDAAMGMVFGTLSKQNTVYPINMDFLGTLISLV